MSIVTQVRPRSIPNDWNRSGLPAWTYRSKALFSLERQLLFLSHWQIAGHASDVANPGDYLTFDIAGERVLIVRGKDDRLRAFHNLCRHRGARVVAGERGHCRNALVCPFHGWVYNLDGTLRGPARPDSFGDMDRDAFGLKPIEFEVWHGFIFVRIAPGPQPSVAQLMNVYEGDLAPYKLEGLVPTKGFWRSKELPVNWKSVRDVDNEGYHVAMAHPALQDLYGANYRDRAYTRGMSSAHALYNSHAGRRWSVRNYLAIAPEATWLPSEKRRIWAYYGIFPNAVISVTPETAQFYQELPLGADRTILRGAIYRRANEDRRLRAARYLAYRIDRDTGREDVQLTIWSDESMKSSAFSGFHLSDHEFLVRNHHDELRRLLPVMMLDGAPVEAEVSEINRLMAEARMPASPQHGH